MDSFRYHLALIVLLVSPPVLLFWLLVHPLVEFWRRIGPRRAYLAVGGIVLLGVGTLFLIRKPLLAEEFGLSYPLLTLGVLLLIGATKLRLALVGHIDNKTLLGLPELDPESHSTVLLCQGPYARVRHPRYLQLLLALLGYAFIVNYAVIYLVFALWWAGIFVIVTLEERELSRRYGAEYTRYCQKVPRFIPRFRLGAPREKDAK